MSRAWKFGVAVTVALAASFGAAAAAGAQEAGQPSDDVSVMIRNGSGQAVSVSVSRAGTEPGLEERVAAHTEHLATVDHGAFGTGDVFFDFRVGPATRAMSHYRTVRGLMIPPRAFVLVDIPERVGDVAVTVTYGAQTVEEQ